MFHLLASLPLGFLLAAGPGTAMLPGMTDGELALAADVIVVGKCTKAESTWYQRTLITLDNIAVAEVLKGERRPELTVVLPGGVDLKGPVPIGMDFEGGPVIQPGEEVLLFLTRVAEIPNAYALTGLTQGKFSIHRAPGAEPLVTRDLDGILLVRGRSSLQGSRTAVPLARFKQQLDLLLRSVPARAPASSPPSHANRPPGQ
ncbi:MAG TPA: hypothetical protein VMW75_20770 [Thermoanaerobaculia bacterium]|nr:hypothetical protein [Thermoanaerobaculia bacterium]